MRPLAIAIVAGGLVTSLTSAADPTSGVDGVLFRSSYDTGGIFAVEGARLMPKRDLSFKVLLGYGKAPIDVAVPGIGGTSADHILDYTVTLDMAFGMTITDRIAIGLDVAAYRTATSKGYGTRGRYQSDSTVTPSTGLVALRELSNIDPSAPPSDSSAFLGDGLAGPLDARAGIKVALWSNSRVALTAVGSVFLPFGDDEMLLGDRNLVFEPKLAIDWRKDRISSTRIVANIAARIRQRTVLESYDTRTAMASEADAKAFLDVGSEIVAGLGGAFELTPRVVAALEAQVFVPLGKVAYGDCRLHDGRSCDALDASDYFGSAKRGDLTTFATAGLMVRLDADVTATLMVGTSASALGGGVRGDDFRVTTGLVWSPQPAGVAATGRRDRDGDGLPDSVDGCPEEAEDKDNYLDEDGCPDPDNDGDGIPDGEDACPNEPEDKDGFKDTDGCPERDNDGDQIVDAVDRCPDQAEDIDGFEDEDGCPDEDNDGDGIADKADRCPNDAETVNGIDDEDGCPDQRGATGPEERADRIDLKGAQVAFGRGNGALAAPARQLLTQVAALVKTRKLSIRVEVHVPLGTKATGAGAIAAQKKKDKQLAQVRARVILDYLVAQGVPVSQVQAVGIGSERPLGTASPTDAINERVDLIKAQQGGTP